jgi:hypothetical protein
MNRDGIHHATHIPAGEVCAVIAAFNAEDTIGEVVRGTKPYLGTVLVADDGSIDGTGEAARVAGAEVISLLRNRGKGNALRTLFAEAKRRGFEAAVALDADGQHDPADIPAFLAVHREHPEDIVTGSRMGEADKIPLHRYNSMQVARFFISLAANQFVEDTQCGYRLYPLSVMETIALRKERYVTETEILVKAGDSGRMIRSIPIRAVYSPGQRTHFRSVPDVAAISVYVISYLMVKWWIEGTRPGTTSTYRGPGTGRDAIGAVPSLDFAFEVLTLLVALPLSTLYGIGYYTTRAFGIRAFQGLRGCGVPVGKVFFSTMCLPLLLAASIVDLVGNRIGHHPHLTDQVVKSLYPNLWR